MERLFASHSDELWRFGVRRVGPSVAEDVVCETFLVAWRRLDEVPVGKERAWLFATARLIISNELRSTRRRAALLERAGPLLERHSSNDDLADGVVDRDAVARSLATLSDLDQEVLRLSEWDQLSDREGAAVLECSVAAYRLRLHRARRRFAAALLVADQQSVKPMQVRSAVLERGTST